MFSITRLSGQPQRLCLLSLSLTAALKAVCLAPRAARSDFAEVYNSTSDLSEVPGGLRLLASVLQAASTRFFLPASVLQRFPKRLPYCGSPSSAPSKHATRFLF